MNGAVHPRILLKTACGSREEIGRSSRCVATRRDVDRWVLEYAELYAARG
jgi:hypothetical protein